MSVVCLKINIPRGLVLARGLCAEHITGRFFGLILHDCSFLCIQDHLNVLVCCRLSCVVLGRSLVPVAMEQSVNLLTASMS